LVPVFVLFRKVISDSSRKCLNLGPPVVDRVAAGTQFIEPRYVGGAINHSGLYNERER
jgi:hypothetical protein